MRTLIIVLLILLVAGAIPTWPHSRKWGPYPATILVVVLLALIFFGRL